MGKSQSLLMTLVLPHLNGAIPVGKLWVSAVKIISLEQFASTNFPSFAGSDDFNNGSCQPLIPLNINAIIFISAKQFLKCCTTL